MQDNQKRQKRKFAWLPTKVRLFNDDSSRFINIWFSSYYLTQSFQLTSESKNTCTWGWATVSKYLQEKE
jgi:lysine/ornithine N-monooxygenase